MRVLFTLVIVCVKCALCAQNLNLDVSGAGIGSNGVVRFNDPGLMGEKSGAKIDYSDIGGNCFLVNEWRPCLVQLQDRASVRFSKFKLNLYTNDIHYLDGWGRELATASTKVDEIIVYDSQDTTRGISVLKKFIVNGKESFFLVLTQGKLKLLKRNKVTLFKGEYDVSRAKNDFRFVKKTDYFLRTDIKISQLKNLSQESLSGYIVFDEVSLNRLSETKNRLKSEPQVVEFIDWYNSHHN